jgi:hypothetical protein
MSTQDMPTHGEGLYVDMFANMNVQEEFVRLIDEWKSFCLVKCEQYDCNERPLLYQNKQKVSYSRCTPMSTIE